MRIEEIDRAFRQAAGAWVGCDWPTQFGRSSLNLNGLKAQQAVLLSRATSGLEAADWRAAVLWLTQVEQDAKVAQAMAGQALALAHEGKIVGAVFHINSACKVESKYHTRLVWQPLREAIEMSLSTVAH